MIIGGTPTHVFNFPIDCSLLTDILITYKQGGKTVLEKHIKDGFGDNNEIMVRLTQEETLMFNQSTTVEIQLKVKTLGGEVIPSEVIYDAPSRCLSEVIL